jgi:hypothetical protein
VELNPWKDWNSQRNVLIKVPSEIARRLTKMTINEALFPVRTLEAFKNAVTTP